MQNYPVIREWDEADFLDSGPAHNNFHFWFLLTWSWKIFLACGKWKGVDNMQRLAREGRVFILCLIATKWQWPLKRWGAAGTGGIQLRSSSMLQTGHREERTGRECWDPAKIFLRAAKWRWPQMWWGRAATVEIQGRSSSQLRSNGGDKCCEVEQWLLRSSKDLPFKAAVRLQLGREEEVRLHFFLLKRKKNENGSCFLPQRPTLSIAMDFVRQSSPVLNLFLISRGSEPSDCFRCCLLSLAWPAWSILGQGNLRSAL